MAINPESADPSPLPAPPKVEPSATPVSARAILIADDMPEIPRLLRSWLEPRGYTVVCVSFGEQVLRKLNEQKFDLLITDILMPGLDGLGVIMKARKVQPSLRVLAMSGGGKYMDPTNCLKLAKSLGADAAIFKPFEKAAFVEAVTAALAAPPPAPAATRAPDASAPRTHQILIVNDDDDALFLLRRAISHALPGYKIVEQRSATGALDFLQQRPVDLILTDNSMPSMSGIEMVEKIRTTDPSTPIVLLTSSEHLEARAIAAGATVFLSDYARAPEVLASLLPHA